MRQIIQLEASCHQFKIPFSALDFDNEDDDSSNHSDSSDSSSSTENSAVVTREVDEMENTKNDYNNNTVNAYPTPILRRPQEKITIEQAIHQCQHKSQQKVSFSSKPPTIIPTILRTKYISTGV